MSVEIAGIAFGIKEAVALAEVMGTLLRFGKDGSKALEESVGTLTNFFLALNPYTIPFQTIMAKIQAGTVKKTMEVMKELLTLTQQPQTQDVIEGVITALESILDTFTLGADAINLGMDKIWQILEAITDVGGVVKKTFTKVTDTLKRSFDNLWEIITF